MTALLHRLFRLLSGPFRQPEPDWSGPVHCVNCGHRYTARIPIGSPYYQSGMNIVDMVQCPRCGYYTVCSD